MANVRIVSITSFVRRFLSRISAKVVKFCLNSKISGSIRDNKSLSLNNWWLILAVVSAASTDRVKKFDIIRKSNKPSDVSSSLSADSGELVELSRGLAKEVCWELNKIIKYFVYILLK